MTHSESKYLHGYTAAEQQRLLDQAEYWRHSLIPVGLDYRPGHQVLEVGCGAGAVLGVLASDFPGIQVAGLDIEAAQIDYAAAHLAKLGVRGADLQVGDARSLPWVSQSTDHVYMMWLLEHLTDPVAVLRESHRVLKPGGTIVLTETDYTTFKIHPGHPDYDYLEQIQFDYFDRFGQAYAGRLQGNWLLEAGFREIRNGPVGFHFCFGQDPSRLRAHVDYVVGFLEPSLPNLAASLGADLIRLRRGLEHFRSIAGRPDACVTQLAYRAHAIA